MEEFKTSQEIVNNILNKEIDTLSKSNENLKDMLFYAVKGGKRIRPIISLEIANTILKSQLIEHSQKIVFEYINKIILFLEFLHSASLILDDMPCMDNDDMRRGNLTFHKKYSIKMAYLIANFMIGNSCSNIVKTINSNNKQSDKVKKFIIKQIFEYNLLTSIGQIKDLDKNDNRQSRFIDKITQKIEGNINIKSIFNKVELEPEDIEKIIWLNMKTYPLFYLSFLLPNIILADTSEEQINEIEDIAFSFSLMFQICDDLEDWEKDKTLDKINSHLKIISYSKIKKLYLLCRNNYLYKLKKINSKTLNYFVEILDKKIELYDNGPNKK